MPHPSFALAPLTIAVALSFNCGSAVAQPATPAQVEAVLNISLPAQPLGAALNELARQARLQLLVRRELVEGKTAPAVSGSLTARQALSRLLAGSSLVAVAGGGAIVVREAPVANSPESVLPVVTVSASAEALPGELPKSFAGGQVARGASVGLLGKGDYMATPFSISSYTEQAISDAQARRATDVLRNDPAVFTMDNGEASGEAPSIRGFVVESANWGIDGLYNLGSFRTGAIEPFERVELIKGPATLLIGASQYGLGGAVNLVSKKAADQPLTRLTTSFISDRTFGAHLDIGRRFGTDNAWGVRANLAKRSGSTEIDYQKVDTKLASVMVDYRGERLRGQLAYAYDYWLFDAQTRNVQVAPGIAVPRPPDARVNQNQPWARSPTTLETRWQGRLEYDVTDATTASVAYGRVDRPDRSTDVNVGFATITGADGSGINSIQEARSAARGESAEASIRTKFTTGPVSHALSAAYTFYKTPFYLYAGTSYSTYATNLYSPTVIAQPPMVISGPLKDYSGVADYGGNSLSSVAFADTLGFLNDRLLLTVGLRRQQIKVPPSYDESAWSPAIAGVYKVNGWLSAYANYIQALEQGPTAPTTGVTNPNEIFPPTKTRQIEAGVKLDFGIMGATIGAYQIQKPNGILVATADPALRTFTVDGEQRNRGLELTFFGEPLNGLRLIGGYGWLDARQTRTEAPALQGKQVIGKARHTLTLSADADVPGMQGMAVTARGLFSSSKFVDGDNSRSIPGWSRFDLGVRYRTAIADRPVVLRLTAENVGDSNKWVSAPNGYLVQGTPRTYWLSATIDF